MGNVTNIGEAVYEVYFAYDEEIRDTNAHNYYGAGKSTSSLSLDVSGFKKARIDILSSLDQGANIVLYSSNLAFVSIGDPIYIAGPGPAATTQTRIIDLDAYQVTALYIKITAVGVPTLGSIRAVLTGVWGK